jgi:hypothetical protein
MVNSSIVTFHSVREQHLQRYVEFAFRSNTREALGVDDASEPAVGLLS